MATSRLEVDLAAVGRNLAVFRSILDAPRAPGAGTEGAPEEPEHRPGQRRSVCGIIKQDAYGLGGARIAKKLAASGVEMLAVYCTDEARDLADLPIPTPLLVLMPVRTIDRSDPIYRLAVRNRLHLVVHDLEQVGDLAAAGSRVGLRLPVHVQLDTGMSRGGALEAEAKRIVELVLASPRLQLAGLMTHFSSPTTEADFTREQARAFRTFFDDLKPMIAPAIASATAAGGPGFAIHAANTAATLRGRAFHATMARIGQGLYGYGFESFTDPLAVEFASFGKQLQPAVRWLTRIAHIHEVPKGWPVGYGRTFKAARPTRVALVPVGYADGYPLGLSNLGKVGLTGLMYDRPKVGAGQRIEALDRPAFAPIIGRVSMDQFTIDVTGLPESLACVGAEIELFGRDPQGPNHLPTLAKQAGTITHELLCRVCPHIERVYVSPAGTDEPIVDATAALPGVVNTGRINPPRAAMTAA
ncbi:MAG: alanine racemase [Phycisphaerales bacterium]